MMECSSKPDLKHLLNEDQEPFVLINYINEKRCERAKAPIPVAENPRFSAGLSRHYSCLFSLPDSPDMKKPPPPPAAPLYEFSSKFGATPKSVFVHVPPGTAALLLEAALRIENSQLEKSKSLKNVGLGFFGTILRKIKRRKKDEKRRGGGVEGVVRWEEQPNAKKREEVEVETTLGFEEEKKISGNKEEEEKFTHIESTSATASASASASRSRCEETECIGDQQRDCQECNSDEAFKEIQSPAESPAHRKDQVLKNEVEHLNSDEKERKEETEHFSPISVFDLDVVGQDEEQEDEDDEDDSELERSFAFVHNARRKLLKKLRRFEKLAGMNPLDLEKRITEDEESEDEDEDDSIDSETSDTSTAEVLNVSNYSNQRRVPLDTKRLVIALMREDGVLTKSSNRVLKSHKLRKRLNSLKNIERNTINMMVQMDFRAERNEWQKNREHVEETVVEIEFAVFGFLVEELSAELVHSNNVY